MTNLKFSQLAMALVLVICSGCRADTAAQTPLERGISTKLQHWLVQSKPQVKDSLFPLETESALQTTLERYVKSAGLPGAVVAIASSQQTWMGATGKSDLAGPAAMQPTARFRIGNLSEMFVAVVCLQLEQEGTLSLKDTITDWLPPEISNRIPESDKITLRQLLNHTSRLPDLNADLFRQAVLAEPTHRWSAKELLEFMSDQPLTTPRGVFSYSTVNYLLVQLMIERATGKPLADAIQTRIIAPLDLKNTFVELSAKQPIAHGYQDWNRDGSSEDVTQPLLNTGVGLGGKGLISNAPDLIQFFRALFLENRLLDASAQQTMMTLIETRKGGYGLGMMHSLTRWGEVWGQSGHTTGFCAAMFYLPVHDLVIVTWTNSADKPDSPFDLTEKSLNIVLGNVYRFSSSATVQW